MIERVYLPILTEEVKKDFFDYIDTIELPMMDYFAVGIQDVITKTSCSIMSNIEWQYQFIMNQYALYDPIRKSVLNTKRNIIFFDEIDYQDNYGAEIMRQRKRIGIHNGIILVKRKNTQNIMVTFGTGSKQCDSSKFLSENLVEVKKVFNDLSSILEKKDHIL